MKFFFCGGSNIDFNTRPYYTQTQRLDIEHMYPYIVSKYYNASYINEAVGKASNKRTIRKIFYEYNMEEFDFICIDFCPTQRTEFYSDKEKSWLKISSLYTQSKETYKLSELYYQKIYNDEYGKLLKNIEFTTIKKYLNALKKPYLIINSDFKNKVNDEIDFDLHYRDYPIYKTHINMLGHNKISKDIIRYCENFLQRG